MAAAAEQPNNKNKPLPIAERSLTEINHLMRNRQPDGSYPEHVLDDVLSNLKTAVQEGGIPHAVSTTVHAYEAVHERAGVFRWMGKTAVENAMSGYQFHVSEAAHARVDVEVDEARHAQDDLRPGVMKIFISPRMSESDADTVTARQEHLADDDAVRVSWLEHNNDGSIKQRILQSLLVRDIPLSAWVAMLQDSDNMFSKSIELDNTESALSVMQIHRELEVSLGAAPDGPVDVVRAVLPYINDEVLRESVALQVSKFESDQTLIDQQAERIAERWLAFEIELEQSLAEGRATCNVQRFIVGLQHHWNAEDLAVIRAHDDGQENYTMSIELAILLENAKKHTLWASAAVLTDNDAVTKQMSRQAVSQIRESEQLLQAADGSSAYLHYVESQANRTIANQQVRVGGGCSGNSNATFGRGVIGEGSVDQIDADAVDGEDKSNWKWKQGICRVDACPTRPGSTLVGPCEVCRDCQHQYDRGSDPTKQSRKPAANAPHGLLSSLFDLQLA